jgi:ribosome recycling factor
VALVKIAKQKLEDAKVSVRTEREKALKDLEAEQKAGTISEDEKFRLKTDVQKIVDDSGRSLDELFNKKEKEILD